ncbi:MAG: hypothetical protein ABFS03_05580 [Chloroflexota bacterium]
MPIDFSPDRRQKVKETYNARCQGELERPIIPVVIPNRDPGRPHHPNISFMGAVIFLNGKITE